MRVQRDRIPYHLHRPAAKPELQLPPFDDVFDCIRRERRIHRLAVPPVDFPLGDQLEFLPCCCLRAVCQFRNVPVVPGLGGPLGHVPVRVFIKTTCVVVFWQQIAGTHNDNVNIIVRRGGFTCACRGVRSQLHGVTSARLDFRCSFGLPFAFFSLSRCCLNTATSSGLNKRLFAESRMDGSAPWSQRDRRCTTDICSLFAASVRPKSTTSFVMEKFSFVQKRQSQRGRRWHWCDNLRVSRAVIYYRLFNSLAEPAESKQYFQTHDFGMLEVTWQ